MTHQKRKIKNIITLLVAALLFIFSSSVAFAETEPNDTFEQANDIGIGYLNADTNANLSSGDDLDYFKFDAVAGNTYVIETFNVQGNGSDATGIWLYNSSESLLANDRFGDNGTGNADARITFTFTQSGTYFILAQDSDHNAVWSGNYSLRVLPKYDEPGAGWDSENDNEPNDALALAYEIQTGYTQSQEHTIAVYPNIVTNTGDHDYYRFEVEADTTYVMETFNVQGNGSDATGIWLFDSAGSQLANDRFGEAGTGNADARITFTFNQSGTYFILVKESDHNAVWHGDYSLRILPKYDQPGADWDPENDHEPNDEWVLAYEIQPGYANAQEHNLAVYSNIVTNTGDHDYYRFTAEAGTTFVMETFNIQGNGSVATGIWLFNSAGSLLAEDRFGDDGTGNADARITFTFTQSGTYFILVKESDHNAVWNGSYSLRVLPKYDQPGADWDTNNDYEPNDELVLAYGIQFGSANAQEHILTPYPNLITNSGDNDYYRFNVEADKTYVMETFNIQGDETNATGLWLFDNTGVLLANDRLGNNGSGSIDARITFTFNQAGTYFILVKESDYNAVWFGNYSLRICENDCNNNVYLPLITN